jgi:hypothetical protein
MPTARPVPFEIIDRHRNGLATKAEVRTLVAEVEKNRSAGLVPDGECLTCGESNAAGKPYATNECPASNRPCGHHCNCSWIHDCCHWCDAEMGEGGEYQVGAVVAYTKGGEPHLAWREPVADQDNDHHWHVFHGMSFGWRTWGEIQQADDLRFLGVHPMNIEAAS